MPVLLFVDGQSDFKASAEAGFADDHDLPLMAGDDSVRGREAQSRSAFAFGRVERLEDASERFRRHPESRVRDPEAGAVQFGARADFYLAAVGHGVHRVEEKIKHDLAQL